MTWLWPCLLGNLQSQEFAVLVQKIATEIVKPMTTFSKGRPEPPGSPRREAMEPFGVGALRACPFPVP
jgi:hypothetical protein